MGGSPLCVWGIYATLLAYADVCDLDRGSDRRAALEEAVLSLEAFIKGNSEIPQSQFDGGKEKMLAEQAEARRTTLEAHGVDVCDPATDGGMGDYYRHFAAAASPSELRAWVARYVSAPRDPADGGCL